MHLLHSFFHLIFLAAAIHSAPRLHEDVDNLNHIVEKRSILTAVNEAGVSSYSEPLQEATILADDSEKKHGKLVQRSINNHQKKPTISNSPSTKQKTPSNDNSKDQGGRQAMPLIPSAYTAGPSSVLPYETEYGFVYEQQPSGVQITPGQLYGQQQATFQVAPGPPYGQQQSAFQVAPGPPYGQQQSAFQVAPGPPYEQQQSAFQVASGPTYEQQQSAFQLLPGSNYQQQSAPQQAPAPMYGQQGFQIATGQMYPFIAGQPVVVPAFAPVNTAVAAPVARPKKPSYTVSTGYAIPGHVGK